MMKPISSFNPALFLLFIPEHPSDLIVIYDSDILSMIQAEYFFNTLVFAYYNIFFQLDYVLSFQVDSQVVETVPTPFAYISPHFLNMLYTKLSYNNYNTIIM